MEDTDITQYFVYLFKKFKFSLRDIDSAFAHIMFFEYYYDYILRLKEWTNALRIYLYFLIVKDKYDNDYKAMIQGEFSMALEEKSRWDPIEKKFLINNEIERFLTDISNEKAKEPVMGLMSKHGLFEDGQNRTFLDHMERIITYRD